MKQLIFVRRGVLEWREAPAPELNSPLEAIVRPFIAARCDGDCLPLFHASPVALQLGMKVHYLDPFTAKMFGAKPFAGPYGFGHECIAEVVSCGADVKSVRPGRKVIVPFAISCGDCPTCAAGLTSRCPKHGGGGERNVYGFGPSLGPWGGMISDQFRVPFADGMLLPVPEGIDPVDIASASDNIPDAWRTVGPQLIKRPGSRVLIVGGAARSIGLYAAAIAVAMGAGGTDYLDTDPARLAIAESVGAIPLQMSRTSRWFRKTAPEVGGDYEITVDCSASVDGLNYAIKSLSAGGTCTGVGFYLQKAPCLPLMQMYVNDSTLRIGVSHPRADLPKVLDLISSGTFQPQKVTTLIADWDDAPAAFLEKTTKVVIQREPRS